MANSKWTLIGTRNAENFLEAGIKILSEGGSAIDAVEKVINGVENNPFDLSVGYNGFPNLLGQVELDASIMVGSTQKAGAVAGVKLHKNPISIARKVMELSPHVLLVGEGADKFAEAIGFKPEPLMDPDHEKMYENALQGKPILDNLYAPEDLQKLAWRFDRHIKEQLESFDVKSWYDKIAEVYHGTVNVIALDQKGELCSGVSTSGLAMKFPGRAGDSPVIGAGNYCDGKYGAAACVGNGELAIRLNLAGKTIERLKTLSVENAVKEGIKDLLELHDKGVIQILAMDKQGNFSACSNQDVHFVCATSSNPEIRQINTLKLK